MFNSFKKIYLIFLIIPVLNGLIFCLLLSNPNKVKADASATTSFTVSISVCGNGIIEGSEQCDGANLGGQTCEGLGYFGGSLLCDASCNYDVSSCTIASPVIPEPFWQKKETKVVLQGKAYPDASVTILIDGKIVNIIKADYQADFKTSLSNLTAGNYNFGVWAEDSEGRKSITFSFNVSVSSEMTTNISGLFIAPTIEMKEVEEEILNIFGQTAPQSEVFIYIGPLIKNTRADSSGKWSYLFNTSELKNEKYYLIKAKAVSPEGLISNFSNILKKGLPEIACLKADLNKDGAVDLIDFSILLHWWKTDNSCADQNQDGIVDLQDFSIMMYYWTG